jgi:hypothetical protein
LLAVQNGEEQSARFGKGTDNSWSILQVRRA